MPDPFDEANFGKFIRSLRNARGLTQEQLAERSRLSADTIRRLEHNSFSPSLDTLRKLGGGLDLNMSTLFTAFELVELDPRRELLDMLDQHPAEVYPLVLSMVRSLLGSLRLLLLPTRATDGE